jgi:nucleotide-binding universal stress UspA family protein
MIGTILLAVDDTPDSLAAARLAIQVAGALHVPLRAVHVRADDSVDTALALASSSPSLADRRRRSDQAVLDRVAAMAEDAGVEIDSRLLTGPVGPAVLDAARDCHAVLVVLGKSARAASGEPYVGSQTRHVLEFSDQPVLVVPPPRDRTLGSTGGPADALQ